MSRQAIKIYDGGNGQSMFSTDEIRYDVAKKKPEQMTENDTRAIINKPKESLQKRSTYKDTTNEI